MQAHLWPCLPLLFFLSSVWSQSSIPPVIPLAIRSPYFNVWANSADAGHTWPFFWTPSTLGWQGLIRVDNQVYQWLGASGLNPPSANLSSTQLTPTQTIVSMRAGPMDIVATFLSPIEASDAIRQSIPFSYVSLDIKARDGQSHNVQVYSDISAEWVTPNTNDIVTFSTLVTGSSNYHRIQLQSNQSLVESNNRAQDLTAVIAMQSNPEVSVRIANDTECRTQFANDGVLSGTPPSNAVKMGNPYPVFSIARNLGNITETSSPIVWAIGGIRDPSVSYTTSTGKGQQRSPLYVTSYSDMSAVVDAVVLDFSDAKSRADKLDSQILGSANNISSTYGNLLSLTARQAMGGTELTIGMGSDGKWNQSDVKMFMRDVGNSGRVNPVEDIYAAFPFFLYINPTYAGQLLSPLLEFQDSVQYNQPYAARDLGSNYPAGTGNIGTHPQGYEHSGNMLIMALAHARFSGDGSLLNQHYNLLKNWADYLVSYNVTPPDATTIDQEKQSNTTNLAIKGIIAIKAMSEISKALKQDSDATRYANFSSAFADTWNLVAPSGDHLSLNYGSGSSSTSWAMMYNLFADRLLQTGVVKDEIYSSQTQWYKNQLSSSSATFGLPLDSSTDITNAAWTLFTAATVTDNTVRDNLIASVWSHASTDKHPFSVTYKVDTADALPTSGLSSPAAGAVFAPLALSLSAKDISFTPSSPGASGATTTKSSIVGPVVGGVVGGLLFIALVVAGVLLWRRRKRQQHGPYYEKDYVEAQPFGTSGNIVSYHDLTLTGSQLRSDPESAIVSQPPLPPPPAVNPHSTHPSGLSAKAREAMMGARFTTNPTPPGTVPSAPASSSAYSSTSPASSRGPLTEAGSPVTNLSQSDVQGLRMEVENLRRVMQEIQADRVEAPPSYAG